MEKSSLVASVPVIGLCAYSGTGKTTLLTKLLPLLKRRGLRVGVVKHTHHQFEVDQPGKDSYELRKAGASEMLVASGRRWALMVDTDENRDPCLQEMIDRLDQSGLDMIIVEGFRDQAFPKLALHRPSLGKPPIYIDDPRVIAVATDSVPPKSHLPVLDLNDPSAIAEFLLAWSAPLRRPAGLQ